MAEHINTLSNNQYELKRFRIKRGKELAKGEVSKSGLYAIVSRNKDKLLRVAMNQQQAEFLCDFKSRFLQEITLQPCS